MKITLSISKILNVRVYSIHIQMRYWEKKSIRPIKYQ